MDGLAEILQDLLTIITNAKTMGALGVLAAVLLLLTQATKVPKIRAWIDTRRWGAWVAIGLGALSAGAAALAAHKPWLAVAAAALGGALAGAMGVGLYEAGPGRSPKRKALALLGSSMPVSSSADASKMKDELEAAKKIADENERLKAKAAWLDRWLQ